MPLILAPTGFTRIAHSQGELAVARAAARAGIPWSLSTMGTRSIEDVAAVSNGDKWFQVYTWRDRGLVKELLDRAKSAGYTAVWLTVDTAVLGRRERDVRRGMTLPPKIGLSSTIVDGAIHPGWTWDFLRNEPITFANVVGLSDEDGSTRGHPVGTHGASVRPRAVVGRRRLAAHRLGRSHRPEGRADRGRCEAGSGDGGGGDRACPIMGAASSMMLRRRSNWSSLFETRSATAPRSSATAVCDEAATSSRHSRWGPTPCRWGDRALYALGAAGERGVDQLLAFLREGMQRTMALTGVRTIAEIDRSPSCVVATG
jgi:L-lactate dehydrogenase (cytochrome)